MSMYPGTGEYCNTCGKVYFYVGDVPPGGFNTGEEPWCTCAEPTAPGIMYTNWCVVCYPDKSTPAEYIYRGSSMCGTCLRKVLDSEIKKKNTTS